MVKYMADFCKSLKINYSYIPGILISSVLCLIGLIIFTILYLNIQSINIYQHIIANNHLQHIIIFSLQESILSTIISVLPGIFIARSLFRCDIKVKNFFLYLISLILVLPVIVIIFGLFGVYGKFGYINNMLHWLGVKYSFNIYGYKGILLSHLFLNLPLAIVMCLQALECISNEQLRLAAHLGINKIYFFRFIEWPYLKRQVLSVSILIFIFCFTSFTVVLLLGGSPVFATIEVAIYYAIHYNFNYSYAAWLSLIQIFFCLGFMFFNYITDTIFHIGFTKKKTYDSTKIYIKNKKINLFIIILSGLFFIFPIISIVINGINNHFLNAIQEPKLWESLYNSMIISIFSGLFSVFLSIMLLWSSRECYINNSKILYKLFESTGLLILIIPTIVISTSMFLLLHNKINDNHFYYFFIIIINVLTSMPYAIKILKYPMYDISVRYNMLCSTLNIMGLNRFRIIEYKLLKYIIIKTFFLVCIISFGNFSSVSLLDNNIYTLPYYFYQQISSYKHYEAAVTALIMLLLCCIIFISVEYFFLKKNDRN
uniref:Thiamine transport system permease protein ThiP n=1 Tax=Candidatus Aschnera chinzeii TaxID=1485666 RepID=A0AAT9G4K2_9ENTR|nr:MAG: thiamine/thiamine pyrophosphate ABC transporter permease ThiP [Candidatus Aschnera chinzeii]